MTEACKLNGIDPNTYLTSALTAIVNGQKQSRIGDPSTLELRRQRVIGAALTTKK